ncbi:membrane dipeptidase [Paenibacillus sp. P96]|uniref:Membrane dipeptidase n=1 Tax=Paenibacillus zeirhizosphaerae TaxID=2987519 RepID=A0ABT9FRY1_9BACL|nr:membrane dipeptidase [Paenibacillus sp. P96]MDP4097465.1 membrane dipeptidase [Paenibacillus sp. P96]
MMSTYKAPWPIADFHCDVLSKMMLNPEMDFNHPNLDVTRNRLEAGGVKLQTFAIYIPAEVGNPGIDHIARQAQIFKESICGPKGMLKTLLWREQAEGIAQSDSRDVWGLLSLEGVDGLEGNPFYADLCFAMGIRVIGLTWNFANWAADGVLEQRNAALTNKGRELVQRCNELGLLLDVSHLSENGFWEVIEQSAQPPIASHSNASAVFPHPRNLNDEQIKALIIRNGRIGLTFVPMFLQEKGNPPMERLLGHLEHICALGGSEHIMFGSDFDGIKDHVIGLEHPGCYPALVELLLKYFPEGLVDRWLSGNALSYLGENLPKQPK